MLKYIIQRVIWIFVILVSTLTIQFVLLKLAPEFPPAKPEERDSWLEKQVDYGYYEREYYDANDPDDVAEVALIEKETKGINKTVFIIKEINKNGVLKVFYRVSIVKQYFTWFENVVTKWDWGTSTSIRTNAPAFSIIAEKIPLTLTLNVAALLFYLPFGFLFGIIAALKKNTWVDNLMQILIMVFLSVPGLVLILILVMVFGYQLEWLPALFPVVSLSSTWNTIKGFIIPVLAMGLPAIASLTRMLRAELSEVLTSEFVLLAKTKGLSHKQAVMRHAIRNSLVPMIPIVIGSFAGLLSGSFIMESVYSIQGVGTITLTALNSGAYDYNVIMASGAFYGIIGLATTLIVDLSYGFIDPRIRMGGKK